MTASRIAVDSTDKRDNFFKFGFEFFSNKENSLRLRALLFVFHKLRHALFLVSDFEKNTCRSDSAV